MRQAWFRKPFYYLFAHFLGTRGVVCQAATLAEAHAFIDDLPDEYALAVGPCRCRIGNRNCDHEIMTDIVIRRTAPIWYKELFPKDYRVIFRKLEAKEICRTSRKAGMIQSIDRHLYYRNSENYFVVWDRCKESVRPDHRLPPLQGRAVPVLPLPLGLDGGRGKMPRPAARASRPAPSRNARLVSADGRAGRGGGETAARLSGGGRPRAQLPGMRALRRRLRSGGDVHDTAGGLSAAGRETVVRNPEKDRRYPGIREGENHRSRAKGKSGSSL